MTAVTGPRALYELRSYAIVRDGVERYVDAAGNVGRPIRGDDYGRLEGHWRSEDESGPKIISLWSFLDSSDRDDARRRLADNARWRSEFLPRLVGLVEHQDNELLTPVHDFTPPPAGPHVYELRRDEIVLGQVPTWLEFFRQSLDRWTGRDRLVGAWTVSVGRLNQVVHLWAHERHDSENQSEMANAKPGLSTVHPTVSVSSKRLILHSTPLSKLR